MKGADVSFVISDGLGDPVVGLVRGAQCNERTLSLLVFLQEPAASCDPGFGPKRAALAPSLYLSSKGGVKNQRTASSP